MQWCVRQHQYLALGPAFESAQARGLSAARRQKDYLRNAILTSIKLRVS